MATHSSILAWKIPWAEEAGGLQSMRSQSDTTEYSTAQQQQCVQFQISLRFICTFWLPISLKLWVNFDPWMKNMCLYQNLHINVHSSIIIIAKVEAPVHWPPDVKSQIIGKDPDAGKG